MLLTIRYPAARTAVPIRQHSRMVHTMTKETTTPISNPGRAKNPARLQNPRNRFQGQEGGGRRSSSASERRARALSRGGSCRTCRRGARSCRRRRSRESQTSEAPVQFGVAGGRPVPRRGRLWEGSRCGSSQIRRARGSTGGIHVAGLGGWRPRIGEQPRSGSAQREDGASGEADRRHGAGRKGKPGGNQMSTRGVRI